MRLKTVIVDDEPLARQLLEGYSKNIPFIEHVASFSNAVTTIDYLKDNQVDLLFLDIQMPQMDGLTLSKMIKDPTRVVFTTAFEQYAVEGFKVDAIDYLLKPINFNEFLVAAERAWRWFDLNKRATETNGDSEPLDHFYVKADSKMYNIKYSDLILVEAERDYLKLHFTDGSWIMILMSMKSIEEILPDSIFVRVHRSYIVNRNNIFSFDKKKIQIGKHEVPVSDGYREAFYKKTLITPGEIIKKL